jgi:hypothetical protein
MKYFIVLAAAIVAAAAQTTPKNKAATSTTTTTPKSVPRAATPTPNPNDFALNLTFVVSTLNLPPKGKNSKIDGYVIVTSKIGNAVEGVDVGTTETIKAIDSADFLKVFWINWKRGTNQKLNFKIKEHKSLGKDVDVEEIGIDVDQYVDKNQDLTVPLTKGGMLRVRRTQPTRFQLYARMVPKMDTLNGNSDPYVEVYWRRGKEGMDHLIGTTAVIDDEENPDWKETFYFDNYQKGTDQYLFFKVLDKDALTGSDFVGELLIEADPYVTKRATKITKLTKSDGKCTLGITPV